MTDALVSSGLKLARLLIACGLLSGLSACGTYVPEGATVVKVNNSRIEFDRAELRPANELQRGQGIKMKWYDENTYITTATLNPGLYRFQARSYTGGGLVRDIHIEPEKNLYEIDAAHQAAADSSSGSDDDPAASAGPVIKGRIQLAAGQQRRPAVSVLFIGPTIELRTATLESDGEFQTNLPRAGTWRVEVHIPGQPPLSYAREAADIRSPLDLGTITLR